MQERPGLIHLGFTGTHNRLTEPQQDRLDRELTRLRDLAGFIWMHNGDCIGADKIAGTIWRRLKGKICLHPPVNEKYRAFLQAQITCEPKAYLNRDHDIVDMSYLLVATPQTFDEQTRSGTWATVRYARKLRSRLMIIYPDGDIQREYK